MTPLRIRGANCVMRGDPAQDVADLHVVQAGGYCFSRWEPTPGELEILRQGGSVELRIMGGQPPVSIIAVRPNEIPAVFK